MDLMARDELMVNVEDDDEVMSDDDEMRGDGGEMMDTNERNTDLMETDDESDNDFKSEQDSDIEFMNNEYLSEEEGLPFYRCLDNNF